MKTAELEYAGKRGLIRFPDYMQVEIAMPNTLPIVSNEWASVVNAIQNPIGCPRLRDQITTGQKVAIIVTDITRKIPDGFIVKALLDELGSVGVEDEDVKVIIATGLHRPNTKEEIVEMLGSEVPERVQVINHVATDPSQLVALGTTQRGLPVVMNKHVVEADLRIATGIIEPHKLAGYSGGVKTMSVGVAGKETIAGTHNLKVEQDPTTRLGVIQNNLFREYLTEIASFVRLDFIVNVIQNPDGKLVRVVAGHPRTAFEDGVSTARKQCEVGISGPADLVIAVPPYPKSRDVYQASRAMNSVIFGPKPVVNQGGTIVVPAPCQDGFGHQDVYNFLASSPSPKALIERIWNEGMPAGGAPVAFKLANIMQVAEVCYTDCLIDRDTIERMHLKWAATLQDAIDRDIADKNPRHVLIMPYATGTLPVFGDEGYIGI